MHVQNIALKVRELHADAETKGEKNKADGYKNFLVRLSATGWSRNEALNIARKIEAEGNPAGRNLIYLLTH